eukprot:TRINITY_DN1511_c0_g2_i1.p1 TRINITY_DN1511_c0_g2~~TRINITY_DN1511_c0_g2_i1.p1  ORF type:complete len:488 (-),score=123.23 TRINITY_DN1511_c0_g2_i1:1564-3027(-)
MKSDRASTRGLCWLVTIWLVTSFFSDANNVEVQIPLAEESFMSLANSSTRLSVLHRMGNVVRLENFCLASRGSDQEFLVWSDDPQCVGEHGETCEFPESITVFESPIPVKILKTPEDIFRNALWVQDQVVLAKRSSVVNLFHLYYGEAWKAFASSSMLPRDANNKTIFHLPTSLPYVDRTPYLEIMGIFGIENHLTFPGNEPATLASRTFEIASRGQAEHIACFKSAVTGNAHFEFYKDLLGDFILKTKENLQVDRHSASPDLVCPPRVKIPLRYYFGSWREKFTRREKRRYLKNVDQLANSLAQAGVNFEFVDFEGMSVRDQIALAAEQTSVLAGVHGQAHWLVSFLRPKSGVVEVHPWGFEHHTYQSLASHVGVSDYVVQHAPLATRSELLEQGLFEEMKQYFKMNETEIAELDARMYSTLKTSEETFKPLIALLEAEGAGHGIAEKFAKIYTREQEITMDVDEFVSTVLEMVQRQDQMCTTLHP